MSFHRRYTVLLIVSFLVWESFHTYAHSDTKPNTFVDIISQIKKAVVFLARVTDEGKIEKIVGTGCLLIIGNTYHLLTSRHNIQKPTSAGFTGAIEDLHLAALFNTKDGTITNRRIDIFQKQHQVRWIFHPDNRVDLAIVPFGLNPQKDDIKTIPDSLFFGPEELFELYDVFFLSFQPGTELREKISPVIRKGVISRINEDGTLLIDGSSFPGNSGSPVFLTPSPIRYDNKGGIALGGDPLGGRFIGIIGSYLPYQEVAVSTQTNRPRVIFEENTGLSMVWPVKLIRELINSVDFQRQLSKIGTK